MKLIFLFLFFPLIIFGQIPDPLPDTYVNDLSGKLTSAQIHELNDSILSIEKRSSVQIAIILLDRLPDNIEIEDYALQVGRAWHVGNADNGLVYVAAIDQHKQRLEVANNLQGDIPDLYAHDITESIKPFFRSQDYFGGLKVLLSGINSHVDPVLKEQLKLAQAEKEKKDKNFRHNLGVFGLWLAFIGLLALAIWYFIFRPRYLKKKAEEEAAEKKLEEERKANIKKLDEENRQKWKEYQDTHPKPATVIAPIIVTGSENKRSDSSDSGSSYRSSSSSSSSSNDSSSYGKWGSESSGSSDSGFTGGGSSNDW